MCLFTGCHRFDQSVLSVLQANVYNYDPSLYIDYTLFIYRVSQVWPVCSECVTSQCVQLWSLILHTLHCVHLQGVTGWSICYQCVTSQCVQLWSLTLHTVHCVYLQNVTGLINLYSVCYYPMCTTMIPHSTYTTLCLFTGCHRFDQSVLSVLLADVYNYDPSLYIHYIVFIHRVSQVWPICTECATG